MTLARADALHLPYADGSFQCAITSPPYFGKVVYGDSEAEHGAADLCTYIDDVAEMASEVARVTDRHAIFWLNIGDTMSGSGGAGGDYNVGGRKDWKPKTKQGATFLPGKQHCLVPQRVAIEIQRRGYWQVKRWIVWDKTPIVRPEDVHHVKRPLDAHETILMLIKPQPKRGPATYRYRPDAHLLFKIPLGDVWHFSPVRKKTGHQAPFPDELPTRCILLSTVPGDRVLDPYVGSGTTTRVADTLGRVGFGADLYAKAER